MVYINRWWFYWNQWNFDKNDRNNYSDCAWLDNEYWEGIIVGNNAYQNLNGSRTNYYITGDHKYDFVANDIEIFGVQLWIN